MYVPSPQYLPNFFYGSLLLWFGIEISRDWLVLSYSKMTRTGALSVCTHTCTGCRLPLLGLQLSLPLTPH